MAGSVSVRTLTARSPGGRDGWAFSETRSDRLAVRLNVGQRYACHDVRRRVPEGPPVSPALPAALGPRRRAAKDSRGLPTITADLKPACRRKVGGTQSLPAAHESLATRVVDPTLSTAERAAGGVGPWETRRRTSGQAYRQPTGGRWARQSDRVSQGPTRPTRPVDRRRLGRHSFELRHYGRSEAEPELPPDHERVTDARLSGRPDDVLDVRVHGQPGRDVDGVRPLQHQLVRPARQDAAEAAVIEREDGRVLVPPRQEAPVAGAGRYEVGHRVDLLAGGPDERAEEGEALAALGFALAVDHLLAQQVEPEVPARLAPGIIEVRVSVRIVVAADPVPSGKPGGALALIDVIGGLADEEVPGLPVDAELGAVRGERVEGRIRVEGAHRERHLLARPSEGAATPGGVRVGGDAGDVLLEADDDRVQRLVDDVRGGGRGQKVVGGAEATDLEVETAIEERLLEEQRVEAGLASLEELRHGEHVADVPGEIGAGGPVGRGMESEPAEAGQRLQVEIEVHGELAGIGRPASPPTEHVGLQVRPVTEARRDAPRGERVANAEPVRRRPPVLHPAFRPGTDHGIIGGGRDDRGEEEQHEERGLRGRRGQAAQRGSSDASGCRSGTITARYNSPVNDLESALRKTIRGDVRFDTGSRLLYSTDASMYQVEPVGIVIPRDADDVQAALEVARAHGVALLPRGGGTSLTGQTVNHALVLDCSRYMNEVLEVNREERWARVQPGVVQDELNAHVRPLGLLFGPDTSTSNRATIGGMLGNNSGGSHSIA